MSASFSSYVLSLAALWRCKKKIVPGWIQLLKWASFSKLYVRINPASKAYSEEKLKNFLLSYSMKARKVAINS